LSRPTSSLKSNIKEWLRAMDWSELHTLHLEQPSAAALRALRGAVPKLQHISLVGESPRDGSASIDFVVDAMQPLEAQSLVGVKLNIFDKLVDGIISQHWSSMKHLNISGRHRSRNTHLILNNTAISRLFFSCTSLETLNIDMATTAEWDYPLLKELASHPRLRSLTLRVEAEIGKNQSSGSSWGNGYYESYFEPCYHLTEKTLINATSAPGLFRYLRKQKIGTPLEELDLIVFLPKKEMSIYTTRRDGWARRCLCSVDRDGLEACQERAESMRY
jgi:hypothetical protein